MAGMADAVVRVQAYTRAYDVRKPHVQPPSASSTGSGFFFAAASSSRAGSSIMTAAHVVHNAFRVTVTSPAISGDAELDVVVRAILPDQDIAILELSAENSATGERVSPVALELGSSDSLRLGDPLHVLGFPLAQRSVKITDGVYSGYQDSRLQHSAPISPGNSGGPLLDRDGRVVGVNIQAFVRGTNTALAAPISTFLDAYPDVMRRVDAAAAAAFRSGNPATAAAAAVVWQNPSLGFEYRTSPEATSALLSSGACRSTGVYVTTVAPGSPAHSAGLRRGDLVTHFDGSPVGSKGTVRCRWYESQPLALSDALGRCVDPGRPVTLRVSRATSDVVVRPSNEWYRGIGRVLEPPYDAMDYSAVAGVVVAPLVKDRWNELTRRVLSPEEYWEDWLVVVAVVPGSHAFVHGALDPGDVVESCCGETGLRTLEQYRAALQRAYRERRPFTWTTRGRSVYAISGDDARHFDETVAGTVRLYDAESFEPKPTREFLARSEYTKTN